MTNIAYSNGTPAVSFTLDRLGRQVAIIDATGTRLFSYNAAFQLDAETNAFGVIVRAYDCCTGKNRFQRAFWGRGIAKSSWIDYYVFQRIIHGDDHGAWNVVTLRGVGSVQIQAMGC
jgi:hypothetical protein